MKKIIIATISVTVVLLAYLSTRKSNDVEQNGLAELPTTVTSKPSKDDSFKTDKHTETKHPDVSRNEKSAIDKRMEKSIERFRNTIDSIPAGAIEDEREDISNLRKKSESHLPAEPFVDVVEDEFGNKVKRYTYENGIVRYGLM